ncbi:MAG: hypothetical protein RI897_1507 [Verrucomicrobiota bacterium]|jgi:hypothetical protein
MRVGGVMVWDFRRLLDGEIRAGFRPLRFWCVTHIEAVEAFVVSEVESAVEDDRVGPGIGDAFRG